MRAVVQRVREARVLVDGVTVGEIGRGLCVLLGVAEEDGEAEAEHLAGKVAQLRIIENEDGKFDRSLLDTGGEALVVSQFTLIADSKRQRGTRPDFSKAARPEVAEPLYEHFCQEVRNLGVAVQTGVFGARMQVELVNDGPVTIVLETEPQRPARRRVGGYAAAAAGGRSRGGGSRAGRLPLPNAGANEEPPRPRRTDRPRCAPAPTRSSPTGARTVPAHRACVPGGGA